MCHKQYKCSSFVALFVLFRQYANYVLWNKNFEICVKNTILHSAFLMHTCLQICRFINLIHLFYQMFKEQQSSLVVCKSAGSVLSVYNITWMDCDLCVVVWYVWIWLKICVARSAYTRRIMEIIGNIAKQKEDIDKVLKDTKELQKEINNLTGQLDRSFTVADELIFQVKVFFSTVDIYFLK